MGCSCSRRASNYLRKVSSRDSWSPPHPLLFPEEWSNEHRKSTFRMEFPMYLVPVPTVLKLDRLEPHQVLLKENLLEEWNKEHLGRTMFVSHEWVGYSHADPKGQQLCALQQILRQLMDGSFCQVESHVQQRSTFKHNQVVTAEVWATALPHMCVWFDFMCIPQVEGCDANTNQANFKGELKCAVDSIPAYIQRCVLLVVLVPLVQHFDKGSACSYGTWRSRGWCRLEFQVASLADSNIRVMVCPGTQSAPYFIKLSDTWKLLAGDGNFTCCQRGHVINGSLIECDKVNVQKILAFFLLEKSKAMHDAGMHRSARLRQIICLGEWLTHGICEVEQLVASFALKDKHVTGSRTTNSIAEFRKAVSANGKMLRRLVPSIVGRISSSVGRISSSATRNGSSIQTCSSNSSVVATPTTNTSGLISAVESLNSEGSITNGDSMRQVSPTSTPIETLKALLCWGPADVLAEEEGGRSLLYYASLNNNTRAVRHLIQNGMARGLNTLLHDFESTWGERPFTPLMAAMVFGTFSTVEVLLDARADPYIEVPGGNAFMLACSYGRAENIKSWLARHSDWDLEWKTNFGLKTRGNTALMSTVQNAPEPGAYNVAKVLLDARADVNAENDIGVSVLECACTNDNVILEVVNLLLEAQADVNHRPPSTHWLAGQAAGKNSIKAGKYESMKGTQSGTASRFAKTQSANGTGSRFLGALSRSASFGAQSFGVRSGSGPLGTSMCTTVSGGEVFVNKASQLDFELARRDKENSYTALMLAIQGSKVYEVRALINARADISLCNSAGYSALELARQLYGKNIPRALKRAFQVEYDEDLQIIGERRTVSL